MFGLFQKQNELQTKNQIYIAELVERKEFSRITKLNRLITHVIEKILK